MRAIGVERQMPEGLVAEAGKRCGQACCARRVGSRIWMSRCKRVGHESRFDIEIKELRVPRSKNQSEDVRWIMTEMQRQFEAWVREAPEQWMWSNRRWS